MGLPPPLTAGKVDRQINRDRESPLSPKEEEETERDTKRHRETQRISSTDVNGTTTSTYQSDP